MNSKALDLRALAMGIGFVLMWSSAFTSARIIVADAPALASLAVRFLFSGAVGIGIALWLGQSWSFSKVQWRSIALFGLCQNALYLGLYFLAMRSVEASLASVLASSMPLFVALLSMVVLRQKLKPLALIGLILGFVGVLAIMGTRLQAGSDVVGIAMCGVGTLGLAVATMAVRGTGAGKNILMVVGLQSLIGAVALAIASPFVDVYEVNLSSSLIIAMLYTTFVPGLLATWVWFKLVERIGTVKASTYHFLNPFFGVLIAAALLSESVTQWDVLGVMTIMAGILAVQLSKT